MESDAPKKSKTKIKNKKKSPREKNEQTTPIVSILKPETEKRLLGNIKPGQKRDYAKSFTVPKIESITKELSPPPKVAISLSELNSVQKFFKLFTILENHIHELRALSCPPETELVFENLSEVKTNYFSFEAHCKKISKQKKLKTEVNRKSFQIYKEFCTSFPFFCEKIVLFGKNIHGILVRSFHSLFNDAKTALEEFVSIAYKFPQSRQVMISYKQYTKDSLKELETSIEEFIQSPRFDLFTDERLDKFSETARTFGRFVELELSSVIKANLPPNLSIDKCIASFHESFVKLVPLIVSAPFFVEQYEMILDDIPPLREAISDIKMEIGDESILKAARKKVDESPVPDNQVDDIQPALNDLIGFSGLDVEDGMRDSDKIINCTEIIKTRVKHLEEKIKELKAELNKPVSTPISAFKDRFDDIRKFKLEMDEKMKREQDRFYRLVVDSIKILINDSSLVNAKQPYSKQLELCQEALQREINEYKSKVDESHKDIETAKSHLSKIYESSSVEKPENIAELARDVAYSVTSERERLEKSLNDEKSYNQSVRLLLNDILSNKFDENTDSLNAKSNEELMNFLKQKIFEKIDEFDKLKEVLHHAIERFVEFRDKLAHFVNIKTSSDTFDDIINDGEESLKILQKSKEDEIRFEQNVFVFMKKFITSLGFKGIDLLSASKDLMVQDMEKISTLLDNPSKAVKELIDESDSGIFKSVKEYKQLCIDLCNNLSPSLDQSNIAELKISSMSALANLKEYDVSNKFKDYYPPLDFSKDELVKKISSVLDTYRQDVRISNDFNDKLSILVDMMNKDERIFIPETPQLAKFKESFQNLSSIVLDYDESSPTISIVKDHINFLDKLIKQIDLGNFSPERTRSLISIQTKLQRHILRLEKLLFEKGVQIPNDSDDESETNQEGDEQELVENMEVEEDKLEADEEDTKTEEDKLEADEEDTKTEEDKLEADEEDTKTEENKLEADEEDTKTEEDKLEVDEEDLEAEEYKSFLYGSMKTEEDKYGFDDFSTSEED